MPEGLEGTRHLLFPRGRVLPGGGGSLPSLTVHGVEEGGVPKPQVVPVGREEDVGDDHFPSPTACPRVLPGPSSPTAQGPGDDSREGAKQVWQI